MKMDYHPLFRRFIIYLGITLFMGLSLQAQENRLIVNTDQGEETISRHIYGHFAEHLGRCIYEGFWVGEDSSIPNVRGIRTDVVDALKKAKIPVLRWPGGCFADTYHWKDGIGPRDQRPTIVNVHWGGVTENNHFGTHEFLDLCEQIECDAYICGNVGSGTVQELAEWVEYVTFDGKSPMADLRRKNGRDEPWKVRFWGIGNENWGCGGNMRPEFYADVMSRFATYVRSAPGNRVYRIGCGAYGEEFDWTEVLMKHEKARYMMQGLSYHYYTVFEDWGNKGSATDFDEHRWFGTLKKALEVDGLIDIHSSIMDRYDPNKRIGIIVDEWGNWFDVEPGTNKGFLYQQNTLRDAVSAAVNLNIFNNHCDRIYMANIAQTVNVLQAMILTNGEKMLLTPTYHVFEMYKVHQDAALVPVHLESVDYTFEDDAINALHASASRDKNGSTYISISNLDPKKDQNLSIEYRGASIKKVTARILTASKITAHNTFDNPDIVSPKDFKDFKVRKESITLNVPSKSVLVFHIK